jgi:7-cyano-7-deazaguanine synthase
MNLALRLGTEDCRSDNLELIAPFLRKSKEEVIDIGTKLNVPFVDTYSCYEGKPLHCGQCGACQTRKQGFLSSNIVDPTRYAI